MIRWTHGLINRLVKLADAAFLILATMVTAAWLGHPMLAQTVFLGLLGIVVYIQVLAVAGLYRVERYRPGLRQVADIVFGMVVAGIAVGFAYHAFLVDPTGGLGWVLTWIAVSTAAVLAGRFTLVLWGVSLADRNAVLLRQVAIVGLADRVPEVLRALNGAPPGLYRVAGIFLDDAAGGVAMARCRTGSTAFRSSARSIACSGSSTPPRSTSSSWRCPGSRRRESTR